MNSIAIDRASPAPHRAEGSFPIKALTSVLGLTVLTTAVIAVLLLVFFDGWSYYRTPRSVRGYASAHRLLRPSGPIGQGLGLGGFALMLVPMIYAIRKKQIRFFRFGSMKTWLQVHIFCGVIGPVLVTFHTSFKFNGIVSVAYWLMILVASSGFVGRYLYVRIPKTLRGAEMTLEELRGRALALKEDLSSAGLPGWLLERVDDLEARAQPSSWPGAWLVSLLFGDVSLNIRLWKLRRELRAAGTSSSRARTVTAMIAERATLVRRLILLDRTKRLFDLWHIFHQPLVYFLFGIVLLHVVIVSYMGYTVFSGLMHR